MFTPLLLSSSIYPEGDSSKTVVRALVNTIQEKGEMLQGWISKHQSMFGVDDAYFILLPTSLDLSKMSEGGLVTTDTCNTTRKISRLLFVEVRQAAITKLQATLGVDEVLDEIKFFGVTSRLSLSFEKYLDWICEQKIV